jgi:hypothetical protein
MQNTENNYTFNNNGNFLNQQNSTNISDYSNQNTQSNFEYDNNRRLSVNIANSYLYNSQNIQYSQVDIFYRNFFLFLCTN